MENSLRDQILIYLDHWHEPNYTAGIIAAHPDIHQQMTDFLLTGDKDLILETCLFLKQVILVERSEVAVQFTKDVYASSIIPALESLILSHPHHWIRVQTSHTLGKICAYDRVGTLIEAFHRYLDTDPLLLPSLLFEIRRLQQEWYIPKLSACVYAAAASWNYLTRWASVSLLDELVDGQNIPPEVSALLEQLAHDEISAIRTEAEFLQMKLEVMSRIYSEGVTKKERRAMRKQINQAEPALTFEKLEMQFMNPLNRRDSYDYHIMELMRFADQLTEQHRSKTSS